MERRIERRWEMFKEHMATNASEQQIRVFRDLFFNGAIAYHDVAMEEAGKGLSKQEVEAFVDDLSDELEEFLRDAEKRGVAVQPSVGGDA